MNILLYSPAFAPNLGGLETFVEILAEEWTRAGCEVAVVTRTAGAAGDGQRAFRVARRSGPSELLRLTRRCEVFFQANVSLRGLWPLLLVRRPLVVSHHSWYCRTDGRIAWPDRLKRHLSERAAASIAVSRAVAEDLGAGTITIGNPYRDEIFHAHPDIARDLDLAAVGRLVSDKGFDLLLDALAILDREFGLAPRLTLIGDGPERAALAEQAERLGLGSRVEFTGALAPAEISRRLAAHRVLVVPSRYREPFGIVVLEGIACGCAVIGSAGGGLADAIGPCGLTFPNGDVRALAARISELLGSAERRTALLEQAPDHLAGHRRDRVARRYLSVLERVAANPETPGGGTK